MLLTPLMYLRVMNVQQLEYIVALDTYRHFVTAAQKCYVTQATLSAMVRKLEDELDIRLFDRSRQPVAPTREGVAIIAQARLVLNELSKLKEQVHSIKGTMEAELRLGIIPTVAPYLLPLFLTRFIEIHTRVVVHVVEGTTIDLLEKLHKHEVDVAILATPLEGNWRDFPLYFEPFLVYAAPEEKLSKKKYVAPDDLPGHRLWLLEEGHCMRSQVMNLCALKKADPAASRLVYEAGSIETLMRLVEAGKGITVLPELALPHLTKKQAAMLRTFKPPVPGREIALVTRKDYVKENVLQALADCIRLSVKPLLTEVKRKKPLELRHASS
jgi:LysR family transcriptional regulator, hydrogen peroxide-inducible genes activator